MQANDPTLTCAHAAPQIYYCLRNGWLDAARRAAERAHDAIVSARLGEGGCKAALEEWARHGGRVSERCVEWGPSAVGLHPGWSAKHVRMCT